MKIKLRNLTAEQYNKWKIEECSFAKCENCPFKMVECDGSDIEDSWINNKEMYSEKFLNQEIEIDVELLTDEEKEYLENVIRPFKDRVEYIKKGKHIDYDYLIIRVRSISRYNDFYLETIVLPMFEENKYYKNLIVDREYTLEELGLFEDE